MLERLANLAVRRRRAILVGAVVLFALAGSIGGDVAQNLSSGGFADPSSESFEADELLQERFGTGVPNVVLVVTATDAPVEDVIAVDDPEAAAAGLTLTARLADEPGLENVLSYWSVGNAPPLRSVTGNRALVLGRITGTEDEVRDVIHDLAPELEGEFQGLDVQVTGYAQAFAEVGETIETDLLRAELIAIPITLLLLLFVFRGLVAASLPLAVGALSVVSTFVVLETINSVTDVSVFALNLTTAMGLGLAIDYSLFVVSRFREELADGHEPNVAVVRTVRTAGRTVAFSAGTVAASLLALLVFPIGFLKSFAYAGVAVASLAGIFSLTVLPALLAVVGHRIDALSFGRKRVRGRVEDGAWYRIASAVMKRPLPIATAVIAVLLVLGIPFLRIELGLPDDRVLPVDAPSRVATDIIRDEFDSGESDAASVIAVDIGDPADPEVAATIDDYAAALSTGDDVARVDASTGIYFDGVRVVEPNDFLTGRYARPNATFLSVVPSVEGNSLEGEAFARSIRETPAPFDVQVTGVSAQLVDTKDGLLGAMPLALALIAGITFVLLFMMFGSVVVPLKALVLNILSLTATFGAMVWIFQDGNLSGILDFTAVGSTDASSPILMFCVAFGLSMDYEVFLLSRVKEEYDRTGDNHQAVAIGLEKTGRIVTAAAVLIAVVFLAFATSDVRFIKLFGLGLALAVLMDAFIIRGTLVPAFMAMADRANWWAPAPLRRFHERFGVSEHVDLDPAPPTALPADPTTNGHANGHSNGQLTRPRRTRQLVAAGRTPPGENGEP
ncbi:MMPL family transporter [Actinospongicola halichondriae]|uniref:MMPL family transporter n=1 Tax=Actinospongicola halichondriae TaxID=3236844 RepID=UPI003D3B74FC